MENPTLQHVTQTNVFETNGTIQRTFVVTFTVGPHGPFTIQIPANDFNAQHVKEAMQKVATEIDQIQTGA